MDSVKLQRKRRNGKQLDGLQAAEALYGGRAVHGEKPPAIDRVAVLSNWRRIWRIIVRDLTPIQRKALEIELRRAGE